MKIHFQKNSILILKSSYEIFFMDKKFEQFFEYIFWTVKSLKNNCSSAWINEFRSHWENLDFLIWWYKFSQQYIKHVWNAPHSIQYAQHTYLVMQNIFIHIIVPPTATKTLLFSLAGSCLNICTYKSQTIANLKAKKEIILNRVKCNAKSYSKT